MRPHTTLELTPREDHRLTANIVGVVYSYSMYHLVGCEALVAQMGHNHLHAFVVDTGSINQEELLDELK